MSCGGGEFPSGRSHGGNALRCILCGIFIEVQNMDSGSNIVGINFASYLVIFCVKSNVNS